MPTLYLGTPTHITVAARDANTKPQIPHHHTGQINDGLEAISKYELIVHMPPDYIYILYTS